MEIGEKIYRLVNRKIYNRINSDVYEKVWGEEVNNELDEIWNVFYEHPAILSIRNLRV